MPPSEVADVSIWLKQDQQINGDKDKFLIMATMSPLTSDCNNSEVAELWKEKTSNDPDVENHRLICRLLKSGSKGDCHGSNKVSALLSSFNFGLLIKCIVFSSYRFRRNKRY